MMFWTVMAVTVALSVWALLGESPTTTQMIASALLIIVTGFYDLKQDLNSGTSELSHRLENVEKVLRDIRDSVG